MYHSSACVIFDVAVVEIKAEGYAMAGSTDIGLVTVQCGELPEGDGLTTQLSERPPSLVHLGKTGYVMVRRPREM